jgi:DNA-binding protein
MPPEIIMQGNLRHLSRKFLYIPIRFLFEVRNMADLPIAAVVRIAKKNGAERVGSDAAEALVVKAEKYIASLTKEANKLAEHAGRKTIKKEDVDLAAKS